MLMPSANTKSFLGISTALLPTQNSDETRVRIHTSWGWCTKKPRSKNAFYGLHLLADVCFMTNLEEILQQLELKGKIQHIQHTDVCRRDREKCYVPRENGDGNARPNSPNEFPRSNDFGPVRVMKKKLTASDLSAQQVRLIIPKKIVKLIFSKMNEKEIRQVEKEPSGLPITIKDRNTPWISFQLKFSYWKSSKTHIFNGAEWKSLCNRYRFVPRKDFLILYMYRMNETLGFFIETEREE